MKLIAFLIPLLALWRPASAAVCNWDGYDDWAHEWNVACSEDITWEDAATLVGTIVFDWTGASTVAYLKEMFKDIGQEIATEVILGLISGNIDFSNGLQLKAAALTATQCYHCPLSSVCYDVPNRHRVCIAYRDPPYKIYVENGCSEDIQVAVRYLDPSTDSWTSKCWYSLDSGDGAYLGVGNSDIKTTNPVKYVYAETKDGSMVWEGSGTDAIARDCRGRRLNMRHKDYVDSNGDLYTQLTCNRRRHLESSGSPEASSTTTRPYALRSGNSEEKELGIKHSHPNVTAYPNCDNDDPCQVPAGNQRSSNDPDESKNSAFVVMKAKFTDSGK